MKPTNLKEFKALKKRYETITLEEIKKCKYIDIAAIDLTGFGNSDDCTLCEPINWVDNCDECVYYVLTGNSCRGGNNSKTYSQIANAETSTKLHNAFRARAEHMKTLLKATS